MFYDTLYTIKDYQQSFTQPFPAYGLKDKHGWKTIHQPLGQSVIHQHLNHEISIATYGRWYPHFGIIDLDDVSVSELYEIRSRLKMGDHNSLIFTSESPNSYHIYFKPTRHGKLMNLNLYLKCMASTRELLDLEIYPQANHLIRLPFGRGQKLMDAHLPYAIDYKVGMDLLYRLEEYDVAQLPYLPWVEEIYPSFPKPILKPLSGLQKGWKEEGLTLINSGLTAPHSRLESLKRVIYFYWSQNVPLESTIALTSQWMKNKHHNLSKDYLTNPQAVLQQITELSHWIYDHFDHLYLLPDGAHILDKGFLTPALAQDLLRTAQGSLPLLKFGLELFAYLNARNLSGNKISVHRDRLVEFSSSNNYLRYLDHFKAAGLLKRDTRYKVGSYAKGITLLTPASRLEDAILLEVDRPASGLHQIIPQLYSPQSFAKELQKMQLDRRLIHMQIKEIWQENTQILKKPLRIKKSKTQERIQEYLQNHPQASHQEIAQALKISTKTIQRYKKDSH